MPTTMQLSVMKENVLMIGLPPHLKFNRKMKTKKKDWSFDANAQARCAGRKRRHEGMLAINVSASQNNDNNKKSCDRHLR